MKKTTYLICMLTVLFLACKNDKKEEKQKNEKELETSLLRRINNETDFTDHFVVILEVLAEKDDGFQLFYSEDYMNDFSEKESTSTGFKGSDSYQKVVFHINKNVFPVKYRIDVGSNREQKILRIKSLKIKYSKNEIVIPEQLIKDYIIANDYIQQDEVDDLYRLNILESQGEFTYDPYFTCSPKLIKLLLDL